jgi:hypothetical protein
LNAEGEALSTSTSSPSGPDVAQEAACGHAECVAAIALAVLAGYAWGRWDALKPFRSASWNGLTEPIRHMGLVTVTCLQFRTLIAKAQKFDRMYAIWKERQESGR